MFHLEDDNELDEVSKTAADSYEAPYNPNWEALQRRLEEELPVKKEKRRRWLLFIFLFASLLAGGSILWMGTRSTRHNTLVTVAKNNPASSSILPSGKQPISLSKHGNDPTEEKTAQHPDSVIPSGKEEEYNPVNLNNNQIESVPGVSKTPTKQPINNNQYPATANTFGKPDAELNKEKPSIAVSRFSSNSKKIRALPSPAIPEVDKATVSKEKKELPGLSQKIEMPEAVLNEKNSIQPSNNTNFIATPNELENKSDSVAPPNQTKIEKKTNDAGKKNRSASSNAFSIAFVTGTDISTIKYKYGNKPGLHAGILAGFHFNKKWSVHSGILYTQNNYKLKGSDYHPPKHYWTQYVKLETVEGYCRMWEIPLQLRYIVNSSATNKWFVSGGLSSYLMKKQQYEYAFKNNLGVTDKRTWQTDSSSNYMLSILHLSAGWEKPLGKRLNLQIEPYAKMPLKGVGFGNIRLSSFGMNFSLQLKQPLKR